MSDVALDVTAMHSNSVFDRSGSIANLPSEQPARFEGPFLREPARQGAPEGDSSSPAHLTRVLADNRDLQSQLDQLRAERAQLLESHRKLMETQRRMMEVLGTKAPEKIVHDLRNVLNERDLLKALVDEL